MYPVAPPQESPGKPALAPSMGGPSGGILAILPGRHEPSRYANQTGRHQPAMTVVNQHESTIMAS